MNLVLIRQIVMSMNVYAFMKVCLPRTQCPMGLEKALDALDHVGT